MSEFIALFLTFLVIFNPPGALLTWRSLSRRFSDSERWIIAAGGLAVAAAGLVGAVLPGEDVIDALDVSLSSFQVGTGLLLILGVLRVFVTRNPWVAPEYRTRFEGPLSGLRLALWIATPASLAAAAFYGADRGDIDTLLPLLASLAVTAAAVMSGPLLRDQPALVVLREAGRVVAIVLVVLAIDLLFDGITRV